MIITIAIYGVLLILLIFFLVKSAATWNWIPITLCVLIFLTSIVAGIAASSVLKSRQAWKKLAQDNQATLARLEAETAVALLGPADTVSGYGEGSLRQVNSELRLTQIAKGRVWEGASPARNGEQITLKFTETDGKTPASQINQDMQLFAFEASDRVTVPGGGTPPAAEFVGSFKVINTNGSEVTLEPVFTTKFFHTGSLMRQLSKELGGNGDKEKTKQLYIELEMELAGDLKREFTSAWDAGEKSGDMSAVISWLNDKATGYEPSGQWTLFEKMPSDSRDAFREHAGLPLFELAEDIDSEALAKYRALLAANYLPAELMGLAPDSTEYEELLDEYTFDQVKTNEITRFIDQNAADRISDRFVMMQDDNNIVGEVKFNAKSESFQVNGTGILSQDGRFDLMGGANDPDLKLETDVVFAKDSEVILPKLAALSGIDMGKGVRQPAITDSNDAEWLGVEYFLRPLRDYPYQLNELRNLTRKISDQRRAVEADIAVTQKMIEDTNEQKTFRSKLENDLQQDIESMKTALTEINRLYDARASQLEDCRVDIRTYYNQIIEMYKEANDSDQFLDTSNQKSGNSLVSQ